MTLLEFSLPVHVEQHDEVVVRPLFFAEPCERGDSPGVALGRLAGSVRRHLLDLVRTARMDEVAAWTFCPEMDDGMRELRLGPDSGAAPSRWLVVTFEVLGRRVAMVPALGGTWVEVPPGCDPGRRVEQAWGGLRARGDGVAPQGNAWITRLEVAVDLPGGGLEAAGERGRAAMQGGRVRTGAEELQRVGRCLDWQYPEELQRAVRRESEVDSLERAMASKERRPVLLVGPRCVGKTALVHEWRYRALERGGTRGEVWLISGQRLVSGMSWLGQWEARFLAILQHCGARDHVLYVDDLLGLYQAGISRDSRLSVADVARTWVQRRQVRLLGEITPEALRVLRERDGGFVDLCHLVWVREPAADDVLRILMHVVRDVERQHRCTVQASALGCLVDLQRRFVRDAAFPGKAALVLRHMAARLAGTTIGRAQVMEDFSARSGLALAMLDPVRPLPRERIIGELRRRVVGQEEALEAVTDAVAVARARLDDPGRPLGVFLFVGPSGVGKTRLARALASWLFGSEERLVRVDMNELASEEAVARLVGTVEQPDGVLTGALRRQPFAVVLLDEIEKAWPGVLPLLLQVLGEGRLSDALGRVADFTQAIIVMTSNLGAAETARPLGLRSVDAAADELTYLRAAQRFFSPEFYNRIDRVVPFAPLSRGALLEIARDLVGGVLRREGLLRRRCFVRMEEAVLEAVVEQGREGTWGARALKRAVERMLVGAMAEGLSGHPSRAPLLVEVAAEEGVSARIRPLAQARPRDHFRRLLTDLAPDRILAGSECALARIGTALEECAPLVAVASDALTPRVAHYYTCQDQERRVRAIARRVAARLVHRGSTAHRRGEGERRVTLLWEAPEPCRWPTLLEADEPFHELSLAVGEAQGRRNRSGDRAALDDDLAELLRELSWLECLVASSAPGQDDVHLVVDGGFGSSDGGLGAALLEACAEACEQGFEWDVERLPSTSGGGLRVRGHGAGRLLALEAGLTLAHGPEDVESPGGGAMAAAVVQVRPWGAQAREALAVIRLHCARSGTVDLRSGLLAAAGGGTAPSAATLRSMWLALLPLSPEVMGSWAGGEGSATWA